MNRLALPVTAWALLAALSGCRGGVSEEPPMYVFPDMDWQNKIQGQEESGFFPDGRGNRPPVGGTVARGWLQDDEGLYEGKQGGQYLLKSPVAVDAKLVARGQERYNIFCAPCHDRTGGGKGMAIVRSRGGFPPPPELFGERVRGLPDGEIFHVISNGVRNMPGYRMQVSPEDRWAIVTWVRVLERSQNGTIDDVPADARAGIETEAGK